MDYLYDWLGIPDVILKHSKGKKHVVIADACCGTGRRLKQLKIILAKHNLNTTTYGLINKNVSYESITRKNVDILIYPDEKITADYILDIYVQMPMTGINTDGITLKKDGMIITSNTGSRYKPKTLGNKSSKLINIARKWHSIQREVGANSLYDDSGNRSILDSNIYHDKFIYEDYGILNEVINHSKRIKRKNITIVDAGCGSGKSIHILKNQLKTRGIKAYIIGIDEQRHNSEYKLDKFLSGKVEDQYIERKADVVLSIGSGPILLSKRHKFIEKCFEYLSSDGIYIENIKPIKGPYILVKKRNYKSYLKLVRSANDHQVQYHETSKNIQIEALLSLKPKTSHHYTKTLKKFGITPHELALNWLQYNKPKDWKPSMHEGLNLYDLFKKYIDNGQMTIYDDLVEIHL